MREEKLADIIKRVASIEEIRKRRDGYESEEGVHVEGLMDRLHEIWRKMTEARSRAANSIVGGVFPRLRKELRLWLFSVEPYGDKESFLRLTRADLKDRRQVPRG